MFPHAYAIFRLIEWQVIRDTSLILHNMNKLFTICIAIQSKPEITELKRWSDVTVYDVTIPDVTIPDVTIVMKQFLM